MRQGGLLLAFLFIHLALTAWNLLRLTDWADYLALTTRVVTWVVVPLGLFVFTWAGARWARWLLAGLFALFGGVGLMAAVLQGWLSMQQPDTPLVSEALVFYLLLAPCYLGMAFTLVRTREPAGPAPGKDEPAD